MPVTLHTKEQVRAYMQQRQREFCRRTDGDGDGEAEHAGQFSSSTLFLPGTIAQLATLLAVEWCFLAAGIGRPN